MKKLLIFVFTIIMCITLSSVCFAAEMEANTQEQVNSFINAVSNSSIWVVVSSCAVTLLSIIGIFKGNITKILKLIKGKADTREITSALKTSIDEVKDTFFTEFEEQRKKLEKAEEDNKLIMTVLSVALVNLKLPASAKTEIVKYLNGINTISNTVGEEVEKAVKLIEEAEANEEKIETPVLDELTEDTGIALG